MNFGPVGEAGQPGRVCLADWERDAAEVMPQAARDYMLLGAMDERTIAASSAAWQRRWVRPRVLTGAGDPDTSVEVFGRTWPHPVLAAPTAAHAMVHPDGEVATARGLTAAQATMTVSTSASSPLDAIVDELDNWWFQAYLPADRRLRDGLVERAVAAGPEVIVLTVDLPVAGWREAPLRAGRPAWPTEDRRFLPVAVAEELGIDVERPIEYQRSFSLDDLAWIAGFGVPVVVKGVLRGDDARRAVDAGAAGVQVSNHGGRQLDGAIPSADALANVVDAVGAEVPVVVDGGVRRGVDVLVALALGATAVAVGKPVLWGLACDGADGVQAVVGTLANEFAHVMQQAGCAATADITPDLLA